MNKKKLISIISSALLVIFITGLGFWGYKKSSSSTKEVEVMLVSNICTNEMENEERSSGMITSDYIQQIFVKENEKVKDVYVKEGDKVSIGDKLLSYDTTLIELDLQENKLKVQQSDIKINEVKSKIIELKNTKPIVKKTSVTSKENTINSLKGKGNKYTLVKINDDNKETVYSVIDSEATPYDGDGSKEKPFRFLCTKEAVITGAFMNQLMGYDSKGQNKINDSKIAVLEVYREDNKKESLLYLWTIDGSEYKPVKEDSKWNIKFISDEKANDPDENNPTTPPVEEGYTNEELTKMIADKEEELRTEKLNKKETELNISKLEKKLTDSVVKSTVNGTVKKIDTSEEKDPQKSFMVVSGGKGYCITGNISELQLGKLNVGDVVTAQAWSETGAISCNATITEISEYPASDNNFFNGGNVNVSYYPFTAVIEETEGLTSGQYVDIMMNLNNQEDMNSIYISKSYVRESNGQKFVYIADENNKLKKSFVETGEILYGDMMEIKSGLTQEDRIAFPYGKYVKEGTKVKEQSTEFFMK